MHRTLLLAPLLVLIAVALAACGGGGAQPAGPETANVTLSEFKIEASKASFTTGKTYRFVVKNVGKLEHEFMIAPSNMPMGTSMDQMHNMAVAFIEEDELQPGQTHSVDVTLSNAMPMGQMELACRLPGHYEQGMKLAITVQ